MLVRGGGAYQLTIALDTLVPGSEPWMDTLKYQETITTDVVPCHGKSWRPRTSSFTTAAGLTMPRSRKRGGGCSWF